MVCSDGNTPTLLTMASPSFGSVKIDRDEILGIGSYGKVKIDHDKTLIGIGSYGKVCQAKCGQLPCAAKLLHDTLFQDRDPGASNVVTKFQQECRFLSTIKHPNIVLCLGTATDPQSQRTVLLMELMDESLTRFLERSTGPLPYHSQLNICHDVALALAYLHSNGITHRDLSSNNVLLIGEGSRAKVTDFGMSKLKDMNPHVTPVPGTPAYMPPEALTTSPHYSCKLDCFSHGVLTLQIITKNFPNPGDATTILEDRRFPTGPAFVPIPEVERRKKDIDLIKPSHPLRPIALHCLKDRDTERPSADELCGRLASLKRKARHSVGHIQRLQRKIVLEDNELDRARAELRRAKEVEEQLRGELEARDGELERVRDELRRANEAKEQLQGELGDSREEISTKAGELKGVMAELRRVNAELEESRATLQLVGVIPPVGIDPPVGINPPVEQPTSTKVELIPEEMKLSSGTAVTVVHGNTAYFSSGLNLYSYAVREDKWTKLPDCKYCFSALAVVRGELTAIGGQDRRGGAVTNALLCFRSYSWILFTNQSWIEDLPPMPTKRTIPAAATTSTHLVVAGGKTKLNSSLGLGTVEVLDMKTLQWSTASSSPKSSYKVQLVTCGGYFYLSLGFTNQVFTCSVNNLLQPRDDESRDDNSVWTELSKPSDEFSLGTLRGRLLVIGGVGDNKLMSDTIHCYDVDTKSWSVIGRMATPRWGL